MGHSRLTRRRFTSGVAIGFGATLAGCTEAGTDDDGDDDVGEENADDVSEAALEDDPVGSLTVVLENEDGEPVSSDVEVTVDPEVDIVTYEFGEQDLDEGEHTLSVEERDDYTVTVTSTADEFDPVEEEVPIDEEDEELTFVLDGATADE